MINQYLPDYEALPNLKNCQIKEIEANGRKIKYFDELVIDVTKFKHPGSTAILQNFTSNSMHEGFLQQPHSYTAKLMLCHMAIGKIGDRKGKGYEVMREVVYSEKSILHQKIIENLDFSKPLLEQLSKLSPMEKEIFTSIPKFFNNDKLQFTNSKFTEFFYRDRFWVSITYFYVCLIAMVYYLISLGVFFNSIFKFSIFICGILTWTMLEYYFHRIGLHEDFNNLNHLNGHYIHHSFPNLKNKLALSPTKITFQAGLIFLALVFIGRLQVEEGLHFMVGLHMMLTFYDSLHYYYHFGPELNIPILRTLRKIHLKHHFRDQNRGFGVTSTLWDNVFGTTHIA